MKSKTTLIVIWVMFMANAVNAQMKVAILDNYLRVYPEDLGPFSSYPNNIIKSINDNVSYGYNTWRLPTEEEMSLINNNNDKIQGLSSDEYMTLDKNSPGKIRLVTDREPNEKRQRITEEYAIKHPYNEIFNSKNVKSHSDSLKVALDYYLTFLSVYPKLYASYYITVAQMYIEKKEYANAGNYLKQALDIQPDLSDAIKLLAYIYYMDYSNNGNDRSKELATEYAKQGARFGDKYCADLLNYLAQKKN